MNQNRELKRCRNNAQFASPAGADAVKTFYGRKSNIFCFVGVRDSREAYFDRQ